MSNSSQEGLHILFFPYPAQGHMLPMLEEEYWDQLRNAMGQGHVWSAGPLYLLGGERTLGRVNPDVDSSGGVMGWLDGCPDGSVLYECFGSQKLLESNQMKALASGLERSRVRFIWVVKLPVTQHGEHGRGVVPDEFEDGVSGKGLVIKGWAPQVSILTHQAVGGFLSHCEWNSVLERITAGVVILSWPMEGDQFVNARLLVEDLGTAVGVCEGADAMPDVEELAQTIINSMSRDIPQRFRVEELRVKALEAVEVGGEFLKGFGWACERVGPSSREAHG